MAKTNYVTRRVTRNKEVAIYSLENGKLELIDTRVIDGRPNERQLAEEFKVSKVVCETVKSEVVTYGVEVEKFMEIATIIEKSNEDEKQGE